MDLGCLSLILFHLDRLYICVDGSAAFADALAVAYQFALRLLILWAPGPLRVWGSNLTWLLELVFYVIVCLGELDGCATPDSCNVLHIRLQLS